MASMLEACRANQGLPAKLTAGSRVGYDLSKVGAGASRGFNGKKKLEAAPWSDTWPAPGSTLDLDFANNRGFVRGLGQGGVMDGITFTRASNGNYINEQGLLVGGGTGNQIGANLLTFPQDFDNSVWTNINDAYWSNYSVISANSGSAPDGTRTADALFDTAGKTGNCQRSNGPDVASTYSLANGLTVSCYVKSINHRYFMLIAAQDSSGAGITVDLETGSITGSSGLVAGTGFVISVGNGWYRVGFTMSAASANTSHIAGIKVGLRDNSSYTFTRDRYQVYQYAQQGTGVLVWGAQLEVGSTATEYFPTNINVPRFDWASTEVIKRWNILSNTDTWILNAGGTLSGVAYTQNATISPENTSNAILLTETLSTGVHRIYRFGIPDGNAQILRTLSFFAKSNGRPKFSFTPNDADIPGAVCIFDLAGLTATSTNSALSTGTITDAGNGWRRVSITWTSRAYSSISLLNDSGIASYDGDGVSGIFMWGFSIEYQNTATPYKTNGAQIPTNTPLLPAPTCNGLLIEEARTNRLLWCRDATQSSWVKTDITAAKDQTGIDGVANAASSLTATADGGTCVQTITLASGSRTGSVFLKRLTGTGTVQVSLDGTTWSTVDLSDTEWRRIVLSGTVTNPVVGIRLATLGDAVAMDFGQVEDNSTNGGTLATSPILTTTAAATRSGDFASISDTNFFSWFRYTPVTLYAEATPYCSGNQAALVFYTNTTTFLQGYSITKGRNDQQGVGVTWASGTNTSIGGFVMSNNQPQGAVLSKSKIAFSIGPWFGAFAANGIPGSLTRSTFLGDYPLSVRAWIGSRNDGLQLNGAVSRVAFFGAKMNEAQLMEITR